MARRSLELIEAMYAVAEAAQPIIGRGMRCEIVNRAEQQSLESILEKWGAP